jgi:hypothetical protein
MQVPVILIASFFRTQLSRCLPIFSPEDGNSSLCNTKRWTMSRDPVIPSVTEGLHDNYCAYVRLENVSDGRSVRGHVNDCQKDVARQLARTRSDASKPDRHNCHSFEGGSAGLDKNTYLAEMDS